MTTTKISLQDVVRSICDVLADLSPEDQTRALEAVRLTLGVGEPSTRGSAWSSLAPALRQGAFVPLSLKSTAAQGNAAETDLADALYESPLLQEKPATRLPTVVVQMMGDRPMVVGQQMGRPGRTLVVVGPQRDQRRQLPRRMQADSMEAAPSPQAPCRGGYVRPLR